MAQNDSAHESGEADEQLKKRARRRLVGAVALVLFAAIVLPMVMDHQPRPVNSEIQVRIPSQEAPAFDGKLPAAKNGKAVSNQAAKSATVESTASAALPASAPPTTSPPLAAAAPAIDKPAPAVVAAKVESKPEPKLETKPVEHKPEVKPETKKPEAARSAASPTSEVGEQWVVQLGAYQEPGRVKLLTGKIKEMRLPVFTEKVDTPQGARTRVRAGPFATKEAALRAQERVKIIGVTGPVAPK